MTRLLVCGRLRQGRLRPFMSVSSEVNARLTRALPSVRRLSVFSVIESFIFICVGSDVELPMLLVILTSIIYWRVLPWLKYRLSSKLESSAAKAGCVKFTTTAPQRQAKRNANQRFDMEVDTPITIMCNTIYYRRLP